jgi:peptide/nickel transport system substrate-binding protein
MTKIPRRTALGLAAACAASLPRFAIGQSDNRPSITIAVQKTANSNTLEALREQSNVGTRLATFYTELLIDLNYQGKLESVPGLATEWRRIDDRTLEVSLRQGVKFHNGDSFTPEDVAASFSPAHRFGDTRPTVQGKTLPLTGKLVSLEPGQELPREIPPVARHMWPAPDRVDIIDAHTVRFVNATPDVTMEGRLSARASDIISHRASAEASTWREHARKPVGTGPYKVREFKPDQSLTFEAHDEYWGGRPPLKSIRFVEIPEVPSRINGLLAGEFQFACDIPPDQNGEVERHAAFHMVGGTIPNHRLIVFDKHHAALRDPRVRQAMTHVIDRKTIVDTLWAGRTRVPAGLQWEFYGDMFVQGWTVPEYDSKRARELVRASGCKGEPIPFRLLNNYYTNQVFTARCWLRCGNRSASTYRSRWSTTGRRCSRAVTTAPCATGPTRQCSKTRSPPSSASTARTASSSRWANEPTPR